MTDEVVHYHYDKLHDYRVNPLTPKAFACGRRPKDMDRWTVHQWHVTCDRCKKTLNGG